MEHLSHRMRGLIPTRNSFSSDSKQEDAIAKDAAKASVEKARQEQLMDELHKALSEQNFITSAAVKEFTVKFMERKRKELEVEGTDEKGPKESTEKGPKEDEPKRESMIGRIGQALHLPKKEEAPKAKDERNNSFSIFEPPKAREDEETSFNLLTSTGALNSKENDSMWISYDHQAAMKDEEEPDENLNAKDSSLNMISIEEDEDEDEEGIIGRTLEEKEKRKQKDDDFEQSLICGFGQPFSESSSFQNSNNASLSNALSDNEEVAEEGKDNDSLSALLNEKGAEKQREADSLDGAASMSHLNYSGNNLICGFKHSAISR